MKRQLLGVKSRHQVPASKDHIRWQITHKSNDRLKQGHLRTAVADNSDLEQEFSHRFAVSVVSPDVVRKRDHQIRAARNHFIPNRTKGVFKSGHIVAPAREPKNTKENPLNPVLEHPRSNCKNRPVDQCRQRSNPESCGSKGGHDARNKLHQTTLF